MQPVGDDGNRGVNVDDLTSCSASVEGRWLMLAFNQAPFIGTCIECVLRPTFAAKVTVIFGHACRWLKQDILHKPLHMQRLFAVFPCHCNDVAFEALGEGQCDDGFLPSIKC